MTSHELARQLLANKDLPIELDGLGFATKIEGVSERNDASGNKIATIEVACDIKEAQTLILFCILRNRFANHQSTDLPLTP